MRAHRFDLAMRRVKFLQRPAPHQFRVGAFIGPHRPEGHPRPFQPLKIEEMATVLWRIGEHAGKMGFEQCADFGAGQVVCR